MLSLQRCAAGEWEHVTSAMALVEIEAMPDADRRDRVGRLLQSAIDSVPLRESGFQRAAELGKIGIKPADALHVAAAEELNADVFLTCDDRLLRAARRNRKKLNVNVANPLGWLQELENEQNAG